MKTRFLTVLLLLQIMILRTTDGQIGNPHILVTNHDKAAITAKISTRDWAKTVYDELYNEVTPYVERHIKDPAWILDRYQMNRVPGKRYTKVYSDNGGLKLVKWEGDAPVPTVKVASHIRIPVTPSGGSYSRPSLEELVPKDTARLMLLKNNETGKKELIDPQQFVSDINGRINELALDAAIIYWLKGDESYAKFAADILQQWVKGAYYQQPVIGPCRTGFLDPQTLGDGTYRSLILAYDFVKPYMAAKKYDLKYYEPVFEKFASTLAFRGFWNNNWYAAESSTMVFAALSLSDQKKKDYYLGFFLSKDTTSGGCGQLALPSTVSKWLTHDGHWKEPGGYHNFPVSNLLVSSLAVEKNGYNIFGKFPELFKASFAMLKYSFPNLTVSAFGDTGRASQSAETLEIGILAAIKYNQPELPEMLASLRKLTEGGRYRRENAGWLGMLCFVPDIPETTSNYTWPSGGTLDFAKYFLQRNGTDRVYGLMYGVQGASYNHNHNNGMAVELYGAGEVMGIDAGTGATYEHPLHVNYYSQWAAHNTVVSGGSSSSVPFSGSAGRKDIGQIELAAMEPMPDEPAVSSLCSFTDTRYFDKSTKTNQSRTLAIVRLNDKSGYYIDIYRSDNTTRNDYVYHNIGDTVLFLNEKREPVTASAADYPLTGKDYPGFRFYTDVRKLDNYKGPVTVLFPAHNSEGEKIFMQVLLPGTGGRSYFAAKSLKAKTAGREYSGKKPPLFTMYDEHESKSNPFIAVYEPFIGDGGHAVESVAVADKTDPAEFSALWVNNRNGSRQLILQSVDPAKTRQSDDFVFTGSFAVVSVTGDNSTGYLYLGRGKQLGYKGTSIKFLNDGMAGWLRRNGNRYEVSCSGEMELELPVKGIKGIVFNDGRTSRRIKADLIGESSVVKIPKVLKGSFVLESAPATSAGKDWKEVKTAEDLCKAYPERVNNIFKNIDLDKPGLEKVKSAWLKNDLVNACERLLAYYEKGKTAAYLRKDLPATSGKTDSEADSIVKRIFTFYGQPFMVPSDLSGHLDWTCHGPIDDIEWAWGLNRHYHISVLLGAYFKTGNNEYVKTIDRDIKDWIISSLPYPGVRSSTEMWRGLEVSFRVKAWSAVFYNLMQSKDLSPATRLLILSSIPEHAHYARKYHAQGNWLTMELSGLATAATSWPELKDSAEWLKYSGEAMTKSLAEQVYPDGVQTELTSSYHQVALNNFSLFMDICTSAGYPVPAQFKDQITKMWNYIALSVSPAGYGLLNNDADRIFNRQRIVSAAARFGNEEWLYVATNGTQGKKPLEGPSFFFPWAGQMIMRSGYDADAHYSFFDIGPWGTGHQHNDKLNITVSAFGRELLVDAGRFAYRGELATRFRGYATGSAGHNLVMPEGKGQKAGPELTKEPVNKMNYAITPAYDYASGSFDRFSVEGSFEHRRAVLYLRGKYWIIADRFATDKERRVETLWHFHPDCMVRITGGQSVETVNERGNLKIIPVGDREWDVRMVKGDTLPSPQGWYSEEYNKAVPSPAFIYSGTVKDKDAVAWILLPAGKDFPKLKVLIKERNNYGILLSIEEADNKPFEVFVPFYDAAKVIAGI